MRFEYSIKNTPLPKTLGRRGVEMVGIWGSKSKHFGQQVFHILKKYDF